MPSRRHKADIFLCRILAGCFTANISTNLSADDLLLSDVLFIIRRYTQTMYGWLLLGKCFLAFDIIRLVAVMYTASELQHGCAP